MKLLDKLFRKQSLSQLVLSELEDARRAKLEAESGRDYAQSLVIYNDARIKRLLVRLDELFLLDKEAS